MQAAMNSSRLRRTAACVPDRTPSCVVACPWHVTSQQVQSSRHSLVICSAKGGKADSQQPREVVVGIDLGTTNSAVAYVENGKPKCIPNANGERITPSIVHFTADGDVVVGKAARRLAATHPDTTYYSVKRLIGRTATDPVVEDEGKRVAYKVSTDEGGQVTLQCSAVERGYIYPEEVSAQVLAQLLDDAEAYTGGQVRKAVLSVPAYFNNKQRDATANAGQLAGLDTVRIIREPVAAALAYGLNLKEDQTVLVFDLGGGTYDISLLEVGNGTIEVLSTGGDAHLGGDDWDQIIMDWINKQYLSKAKPPLDPNQDPKLRANLRALAEAAKYGLTDNEEVQLRMPVGGPKGGPLDFRLSREQFEQLCEPLWRRARLPLDQACWQAGVDLNALTTEVEEKKQALAKRGVPSWKTETMQPVIRPKARNPLTKILLVGGASRMPAVTSFIRHMTGLMPEPEGVNLDEAVALGAAVQAGILQGEVKELMVMDQWQASLMRAVAKMQLKKDTKLHQGYGPHVKRVWTGSTDQRRNTEAERAEAQQKRGSAERVRAAVEERYDLGENEDEDDEDVEAEEQERAILEALEKENREEDERAAAAGMGSTAAVNSSPAPAAKPRRAGLPKAGSKGQRDRRRQQRTRPSQPDLGEEDEE